MIKLPPYRYIKDRSVSDYTYSEHADGYDDCLTDIMGILEQAGIPFARPDYITKDQLEDRGLLETGE